MTGELQQNRYDQLIRRVGGIIGPGSKVSEALSELFPVIDVERVPGELMLLMGTHLCFGSILTTGAAGQSARNQLFNPANSGKLIAVSSVLISSTNNQTIRYSTTEVALATPGATEKFRDTRLNQTTLPTGQIRSTSSVATTAGNGRFRIIANERILLTDPNAVAILGPGSGFEVGAEAQATSILVTYNWRERVAEQSELSF